MGTEPTVNTDDQELAKALAGISDEPAADASQATGGLSFEEAPTPAGAVTGSPFDTPSSVAPAAPEPAEEPAAAPVVDEPAKAATPVVDKGLESIKKNALNELRPLVDKLTVPAEEKFDTYLLLLRSTDDTTLIAPAHEAAKEIPDEARRAQALLDVIKEIDYLSNKAE